MFSRLYDISSMYLLVLAGKSPADRVCWCCGLDMSRRANRCAAFRTDIAIVPRYEPI